VIVHDGREIRRHAEVAPMPLTFSPSSDRLAYVARDRGEQFTVLDGRELLPTHQSVKVVRPSFSPDSRHVAYMAAEGTRDELCVDSESIPISSSSALGTRLIWDGTDRLHTIVFEDREVRTVRILKIEV
jgi:hypothetical protein